MNPAEFSNIAATEETFWWFRGMNRMLWDFLTEYRVAFQGKPALELGCGTGWVSSEFLKHFPGCPLTSMDLASEGLRYAQRRGLTRLAQGDIRQLPFADASFHLAITLDVIVHLERGEERRAFAEFARVLEPGGILLMRAAAFSWLRSRHSVFVDERQRIQKSVVLTQLQDCGFEPLRSTYANTLLLPVSLLKSRVWEPMTNAEPASGLTPMPPVLNRLFETCLMAEAAWLRGGHSFPVGQSLWVLARKVGNPT